MKTYSYFKKFLVASVAVAGINMATSCDSCNRKDDDDAANATIEAEGMAHDTLNNDHASGMDGDGATAGGSGSAASGRAGTTGTSGSGTSSGGSSSTSGRATSGSTEQGSGGSSTGYGDSNSSIENSSAPAVDKQGRPIISGGSAGTGSGTGTGSTGNNSKVSRPEDQRN